MTKMASFENVNVKTFGGSHTTAFLAVASRYLIREKAERRRLAIASGSGGAHLQRFAEEKLGTLR